MDEQFLDADAAPRGAVKNASDIVRKGFVRKVYGILSAQLVLTTLIGAPFQYLNPEELRENSWLLCVSAATVFVTLIVMICCQQKLRQYPTNYCMLFAFTAAEGVLVGFSCSMYTWQSVALAYCSTVVIFLALTAFAWTTSADFTKFGPYLFVALVAVLLVSVIFCFLRVPMMMMVYDFCCVLLFSFYIVYDTQCMLGKWGGHKMQFEVDDYCLAALCIYMDLLNLFLTLLSMFGDQK
eukprot:NODE_17993_length_916_cov_4.479087.p1 GENE.NODE_17993_length_916_cov_4.479087~~NODE_17993_length_916_cov_4.479087.p1  ORF type:complete len:238 (-),score=66.74 NODE_17993_length_916_cov_4.479087:119-832(-)